VIGRQEVVDDSKVDSSDAALVEKSRAAMLGRGKLFQKKHAALSYPVSQACSCHEYDLDCSRVGTSDMHNIVTTLR
jgi:hypothetical protein